MIIRGMGDSNPAATPQEMKSAATWLFVALAVVLVGGAFLQRP